MMPGKPFQFLALVLCAWFSGRTATWLLPEFTRGVGVNRADPRYRKIRYEGAMRRGPLMPPCDCAWQMENQARCRLSHLLQPRSLFTPMIMMVPLAGIGGKSSRFPFVIGQRNSEILEDH